MGQPEQPELDPAAFQAMMQQFAEGQRRKAVEAEVAMRREMLRWSAIICSCAPWGNGWRSPMHPAAGCSVHGGLVLDYDGRPVV